MRLLTLWMKTFAGITRSEWLTSISLKINGRYMAVHLMMSNCPTGNFYHFWNKVFELTIKGISISYSNYEKAWYRICIYDVQLVTLNKPIHLFDLDVFIALLAEYRRHCNQNAAYVALHTSWMLGRRRENWI